MSGWSNWIYLAIGLGLGVSSRWSFGRTSGQKRAGGAGEMDSQEPQRLTPSIEVIRHSDTSPTEEVAALTEKLKLTEIAYQLAQQMSQFKAGFLARTSHELRSPLNSLIGLHQLILSDLCDDPAEERTFVAQANSSALKLIDLIDRILEVSRLEHGNSNLEIQPLQLATILTEVYNSVALIAANRNIRLHFSPPEAEIYVLADPRWLRQVFLNLLDSCLTQMQEGSIFVSTPSTSSQNNAQICLDVELPVSTWLEPVDLSQTVHLPQESVLDNNIALSPGMTLLLTQTLLELMHGRLEIFPVPDAAEAESQTRMQLTIPLVIPEPEAAFLEPEENQSEADCTAPS
ncbi:MAG TPA: sensor histidine kinase [Cyanobacteria bacterium UBA11049]|nr:sensor histidine kinase [Cyanobacteria bacterium UBA11049]